MNVVVERLTIPDVLVVRPRRFADARGFFAETWSLAAFSDLGISTTFIQDNESLSICAGTVRGFHFQRTPFEQAKLVRVLRGAVYDVVVDIRPASPHYKQWCGIELREDDGVQLFIPRGFAHGFATLEPETVVAYKVDAPYARDYEGGIKWDDPMLGVNWPVTPASAILSDKDALLPNFSLFEQDALAESMLHTKARVAVEG